jgi:hypothetical protein
MSPAAECSHLKCARVLASAACIAASIAVRKPQNLVRCVKGGKGAVSKLNAQSIVLCGEKVA